MTEANPHKLGIVTSGSLARGIDVRLESPTSVEEMAVGRYVTIQGQKQRFLGMLTDVSLEVTDPKLTLSPPDTSDPFMAEVLSGTGTYGSIHVVPQLSIGADADAILEGPGKVKTVPSHFSAVYAATQQDIEQVFGKEDEKRFHIGNPLDMETKLCLDMVEFARRSNGVFGKSGTGKTFFTRMLLIGMLQKSRAANLIFDMQNEYGWKGVDERGTDVKGLKQLFPASVAVFALDEKHSQMRGLSPDFVVRIGYDEIDPQDIALLRQTLNLTELAVDAAYQLRKHFHKSWIKRTLELNDSEDSDALLKTLDIHESTFRNLRRGLATLERLPFLVESTGENTVAHILEYLDKGMNVVLEFGRFRDITTYILVANMLTRRIYTRYQERMESATKEAEKPRPLVITIEEAHKFLSPDVASQTIFGTIAREMRKYNVTLLVIDQRPSGIDEEVMSQIGTKINFLLDNERDIDSVLSGAAGKSELKTVLAKLESKQQSLIFGHALPMPIVIKCREYGSAQSYKDIAPSSTAAKEQAEEDIEKLWG